MSNKHLVSELTYTVIDSISAEPDPIVRLQSAMLMRETILPELSKLINESIYQARLKNPPDRLIKETGLARYTIRRHVSRYLEKNPTASRPPSLIAKPIPNAIPLPKMT